MAPRRSLLAGQTVLITGAARGIGADAAQRLAARGAQLVLIDRDGPEVERVASELGARAVAFPADVTSHNELDAAVAGAIERFRGIDVVVANAGVTSGPAPVISGDADRFEQVIDVNLLGLWRTIRAALPHVVERQGYVLAVASLAAAVPLPLDAAYAASKHGVEGFARSLRIELAHTGTRVGIGYFGFIDTDMVRDAAAAANQLSPSAPLSRAMSRPLPVSVAGEAVVRGVERRAKRVYAPRWIPAVLALRGLAGPLEALAARDPRLTRALGAAESAAQATTNGAPTARTEKASTGA